MSKHFNKEEWIQYCQNRIDEEKMTEMEEHLSICNDCLNIYLTAIEENELQKASDSLSPNFTDTVMERIGCIKAPIREKEGVKRSNLMIYYTAAACITIILTLSGTFQSLSTDLHKAAKYVTSSQSHIEKTFSNGWTERLTNRTLILLDGIKPNEDKE